MTTLTFQNTTLSVINHHNQIWLTASEVGKGLGYSQTDTAVKKIYERHADEFTPCMTALVDMPTAGGVQKVRIFSLRGCHLIGMLSHTKVAKDFRKWVLDILDKETAPKQLALPVKPERSYHFELTETELKQIAWTWVALKFCLEVLNIVAKPLQLLGSYLGHTAHSHALEYGKTLLNAQPTIDRLTRAFEMSKWGDTSWNQTLPHIRSYDKAKHALRHKG